MILFSIIDSKAFIEYWNDLDNTYKNIEEYNPNKKRKILPVFDDIIADMISNEKLNPIVTELYYLLEVQNETFLLFFLRNPFLSRIKYM